LHLKPQVNTSKKLNCLLNVRVVLYIDADISQTLVS